MSAFLSPHYPPSKARFLEMHGGWWYGGDNNRWVILADGQIAAYCAVIPARIWIAGRVEPALWWVDLVVSPPYRGGGLQSIFDREILKRAEIKLGFPNELAARIHRKHGWGVREDLQVLLLPLKPFRLKHIKRARGMRRLFYNALALALTPWSGWYVRHALRYRAQTTQELETPTPELLAGVFERYRQVNTSTTNRDRDFFQWRYFDSPWRDQYHFYIHGDPRAPSHYAITRLLQTQGETVVRILDLFGNLQDRKGLTELVQRVVADSVRQGASQITILVSLPGLKKILRAAGFILSSRSRFCWSSKLPEVGQALLDRSYWTLADSDNDEPGDGYL